jgi:hypothetical protein
MAKTPTTTAPAPEFPSWPFSYMALYSHLARDFGRYAQTMTEATDAMQAIHAEGDYGANLYRDLMQGYYELALAPFNAMVKAASAIKSDPTGAELSAKSGPHRNIHAV